MKISYLLRLLLIICVPCTIVAQKQITSGVKSLNITKEVKPPILNIVPGSIKFVDQNGNNAIDANETCSVQFKVNNSGRGDAYGCEARISVVGSVDGINFETKSIPTIKVGETVDVNIPLTTEMGTVNGTIDFGVEVYEPMGFGEAPIHLAINTKAFNAPLLQVTDYAITGSSDSLEKKKPFDLQVVLQNTSYGVAENVIMKIELPDNVLLLGGETQQNFQQLGGGKSKLVDYTLIVNNNYNKPDIPVKIILAERYGKFAESRTISLNLNQALATTKININEKDIGIPQGEIKLATIGSDVDSNIPVSATNEANTFVLIIANQNYQKEKPIITAKNDGAIVREYCLKTLGVPAKNIKYRENCTWKNMESEINAFAYSMEVNPDARFMLFYFGHGMVSPDKSEPDSYFLPIDGSSIKIKDDGFSRNKMLSTLAQKKPKQCLVFLESCFSGTTPNNEMLSYAENTSGMRFEDVLEPVKGNIVVMTASSAAQTANAYPEKGHNLFTYEFLKLLQSTEGNIFLGDLFAKLQINTSRSANNNLGGAKQIPTVIVNTEVGNSWKGWKLK